MIITRYILCALGIGVIIGLLVAPLPTNRIVLNEHEEKREVTIVFGGDMMFDRYIRQISDLVGGDYVFSCIDSILFEADTVVANLEGPITTHESISIHSEIEGEDNYTFTFPPNTATLLKRHNVGIVNLGNNHITNFGFEGIVQTKIFLHEAHVEYFGDPMVGEEERVLRKEINGINFSFVNWSDWTSDKTDHTISQVRKEKESGNVVVVYTHWGDEYLPAPERVKQLARSFVDAGASIVVGSHPHIVQEHERYKEVSIYYSLGNFIFDQYFDEAVMHGLLLKVSFDETGVLRIQEIDVELLKDGRTCPILRPH